jgi:hypothetical protein
MMETRKGWRGDSFRHALARQRISTGMKRPNHKLHLIKGLVREFQTEALKGKKANPRRLYGIAGKVVKMRKR